MNYKCVGNLALAALLAGLSSLAVGQNLAVVNGQPVPMTVYTELSQQIKQRAGRDITPEMEKQIKDQIIVREVLLQEAKKQGMEISAEDKKQLEMARESMLINELFLAYQKKNPVTEADIKAEYDKFAANSNGKEYHAYHILVDTEAQAKDIIAQLKKGAKFEDLATKLSKDPGSAAKGGDLGWAAPANYVPEFATSLLKMTKGQTTETPFKSEFGYHVVRLDDVRDANLPTLEEIKSQIVTQLERQKLEQYQTELRSKARIE